MIRRFFLGFCSLFSLLIALSIIALPAFQPSVSDVLALATIAALLTVAFTPPAAVRSFQARLRSRPDFIGDGSTI